MDKFGVIWTRYGGQPCKLADMVLTPSELRITKHPDAVGLPGPSLIHDKLGISTIEYKRDQWRHLPPQLEALLPPSNRDNPQRVILSKLLSRHIDTRGMPIIEQEWEMLLFAGRNGIGHLDVFPSDQIAERIYAKAPLPTIKASAASDLWATFKRIAEDTAKDDNEIDEIVQAIGPTPGISGFNPKLFVELDMRVGRESRKIPRFLRKQLILFANRESGYLRSPPRKDSPTHRPREYQTDQAMNRTGTPWRNTRNMIETNDLRISYRIT